MTNAVASVFICALLVAVPLVAASPVAKVYSRGTLSSGSNDDRPLGLNPRVGPVKSVVKSMLERGEIRYNNENENNENYIAREAALPVNFDARNTWPTCIPPVLNQGDCGSCWSFAATKQLATSLCIARQGASNSTSVDVQTLSPQYLLSCEHLNLGCEMGSLPQWADAFLEKHGVTTLECTPYLSGDGHDRKCVENACTNTSAPFVKAYAANHTHVASFFDPTSKRAQIEIKEAITRGPVTATFNVFSDFMDYSPGEIYEHKSGSYEGLHSVMVVGFGVDESSGIPYYSVSNSWGPDWGDNGYFRIRAGIDTASFERLLYQALPDVARSG